MPSLLRGFFLPGFTTAIHNENDISTSMQQISNLKVILRQFCVNGLFKTRTKYL
jgi:hypothetical protein